MRGPIYRSLLSVKRKYPQSALLVTGETSGARGAQGTKANNQAVGE